MLLFVFFLAITTLGQGYSLRRYGYVKECVEPGLKCESCSKLIFCVGEGTDKDLKRIELKSCNNTEGQYCSVGNGGCTDNHRACDIFGLENINCQDVGFFPDPFDCTSYHICSQDGESITGTRMHCKTGLAYDPLSTICRLKKSDRVCTESPVPKCLTPLQMGALVENPTLYYICVYTDKKELYPRLYRCPYGLMFDAINAQCVETLPNTTPQPKQEFKCSKQGTFPDPYDCHSYYICESDLKPQHKTCRVGFYFDSKISLCALGFCENQIQ
uniref:Chitin-binding type-2 domain-containing protein n=1 Tax=Cacopsylla melanoneura TaxID=428564 RepID=A0A8D8UZL7_9HEMI